MSAATRIQAITVARLDIPLFEPFGISGGAQPMANNVLVTVQLADGTKGYGEAAPLPPYNGETQAQALAALQPASTWCAGRDVREWRAMAEDYRERGGQACGSAQCALEMALLDALTRQERRPMWKFFRETEGGISRTGTRRGAARPAELETDMTVTTGSAAEAAAAARSIRARGIRVIKVKIGGKGGAEHDLARLQAIHEAAPDSPLVLDGNAGVSRAEARDLVQGLKARKIAPALLEQWLAKTDLEGMRALAEESGWLVAADEAVTSAADATRVADAQAAQVINIKLMKAGIITALEIAAVARKRGLALMIGGNVESILAMTTSACFAAGLGGFRFADLDTPLFLAENPFAGGFELEGGRISLAGIKAGHGVAPKVG